MRFCNSVAGLVPCVAVPQPRNGNATRLLHRLGLGSSRFARRYSGNHGCFLFLGVLRCFNSPGSLYWSYVFRPESHPMTGAGFPHSDIYGSKLVCQLPVAFRRLPRPSSPVIAKASTTCTCSLDPITGVSHAPSTSNDARFTSLQVEYSCCAVFQGNLSITFKIH